MTRKEYIKLLETYIKLDEEELKGEIKDPVLKGYYMGSRAIEQMFLGFLKADEENKVPWEE